MIAAHLIALGLWGGIVLVEVLFEGAALAGRFPVAQASALHRMVDRALELPALAAVVGTGLALWARTGWAPELLPKVSLGLGAVGANLACVVFVELREARHDYARQSRRIAATIAVGLPLGLAALALGGRRAAWW